jgi:hypothetical protein
METFIKQEDEEDLKHYTFTKQEGMDNQSFNEKLKHTNLLDFQISTTLNA